jgi:single-strand DNA-binding protein
MINEAQVFLAGYVAREPRFRITTRGISSVSLRVACTPRWVDRESGEWTDGETSFVTVLCWRTLADNVAKCLHKGEPVLVKGRLHVRPYEKDGVSRLAVEIEATSVGHDLARGVASFQRPRRPAAENGAPANGAAGNGGAGNGGAGNGVLDGTGAEPGHPGGLGAEAGPDGTDAALAALSFAAQEARNGTDPALATPDEVAEPAGVSAPF